MSLVLAARIPLAIALLLVVAGLVWHGVARSR